MKPSSAIGGSFDVLLRGPNARAGDQDVLLARLQKCFRITSDQARRLLGWRGVLKRTLSLGEALRLASALRQCGLDARIAPGTRKTQATDPVAPDISGDRLAAFFESPVFRERLLAQASTGPGVSLRLCATALLLVLAPPLYVLLVLLFGAAWLLQLGEALALIGPQGLLVPGMAALTVLLSGGIVLAWLLAPCWPAARRPAPAQRLEPAACPALFALVDACSRATGTASPVTIVIDLKPELRLEPAGGLGGWWQGRTRLRIGLPLLAVLEVGELAGLLTAALGSAAARRRWRWHGAVLTLLRRHHRAREGAAERAEGLQRWHAAQPRGLRRALALIAAIGLQLAGLLQALLEHVAQALAGEALRELERRNDLYHLTLSGPAAFIQTLLRLRALRQVTLEIDAAHGGRCHQRLPLRDLATAVQDLFQALDGRQWQALEAEARRDLRDSGDGLRLVAAERFPAPPRYVNPQPAHKLVPAFPVLSVELTAGRYAADGRVLEAQQLRHPARARVQVPPPQAGRERQSLAHYFQGQFRAWPMFVAATPAASSPWRWHEVIEQLRLRSPEMTRDWALAHQLEQRRPRLLLATGLALPGAEWELPGIPAEGPGELLGQLEAIRERRLPVHRQLRADLELQAWRIDCALCSLGGAERRAAEALRALLVALASCEPTATRLLELVEATRLLPLPPGTEARQAAQRQLARAAREQLARLLEQGRRIPQVLGEGDTLTGFLERRSGDVVHNVGDPLRFISRCGIVVSSFQGLYQRALARLAERCALAEQKNGIAPLRLPSPLPPLRPAPVPNKNARSKGAGVRMQPSVRTGRLVAQP